MKKNEIPNGILGAMFIGTIVLAIYLMFLGYDL